jgi:acyl carrier protein
MRNDDGRPALTVEATPATEVARRVMDAERTLARIFAAVLSIPDVSPNDNFFDLGMTSLLMVRVRNQIKTELGRELAVEDLFAHPNVSDLARFLGGVDSAGAAVASARVRGARQNDLFQRLRKFSDKASR